ncbi:MAG TPA: methionyl-tRNA formyltransferase [Dehalococcoidia bacterium]|nr:methionyl-tRNA formyltransferase [Dehalococcoidia bacterium]
MKIALIGQAAFGKAVFEALRAAGEEIVAVSSITGTAERPDALWAAAQEARIAAFPTGQLKKADVLDAFAATKPDLGVMAFVTHILPERVLDLPPLGTIQYHPSLLPRHRGISAMHWAIRAGETQTGLSIFWVDKGIDTGPVLLQRETQIAPDDTVGSLYFDRLFQMGVDAMVDAVRLVREGAAPRIAQDEAQATYEPPASDENSAIQWSRPAREVYNLIRGSNPTPGAHALLGGRTVRIFDARLSPDAPAEAPGTVLAAGDDAIAIALAGGTLRAQRLQLEGGRKLAAGEFAAAAELRAGTRFGDGAISAK